MRTLVIISLLHLLSLSKVQASGCGRYDNYRDIVHFQFVQILDLQDYQIEMQTEQEIILRNKVTQIQIILGLDKLEKAVNLQFQESSEEPLLVANDVLFEEGNGCGPVYRCVTGQIQMKIINHINKEMRVFSYPVINTISSMSAMPFLIDRPLIPVFENLELDVPSLKDSYSKERLNDQQCGYGMW